MKVLVIAPQPFFSYRGTPFSIYFRTLVMSEQGLDIEILTYGQGKDVDLPGVRILRIPAFTWLGPVPTGPSVLKLFLDVWLVLWTIGLLLRKRYDVVHAHEEAAFFCALLKPLFRFKMIYDMHSSLPQQLTNFNFTTSRMILGAFKWLEDLVIRRAEAVITICPDLADYALGLIGDCDKHFLIENSIFEPVRLRSSGANPGAGEEVEPPFKIPAGARTVVYAGTLEAYQGIDLLIEAFRRVHAKEPRAFLVVVGGTPAQVVRFRAQAGPELAECSVIYERVPQAVARRLCAEAAVQMSPRISGTNTPLKVYEQLASGVPLVATAIQSHTQVLNQEVAYLVKSEPGDMARGILEALADGHEANLRTRAAQRLYAEKYSRLVYEVKLRRVLERIRTCAA